MFIVNSYGLAVLFCFITMLCWGSWGNSQKLAAKSWRYELFYWDYVIGMVLFSLLIAFTMGSIGTEGRPFLDDLKQMSSTVVWSIALGGFIFNASNILLSASTSIAGMSVAFPLGVGLALVLGVINNYIVDVQQGTSGNVALLIVGVAMIVVAIVCNGLASGKRGGSQISKQDSRKGILLAICAGVMMSFWSRFVAGSMDLANFATPAEGMVTPYTAGVLFALAVFVSNILFNTFVMRKPFVGAPVSYSDYFKGSFPTHLVGMLGGAIWCLGTIFNNIAMGKAGASISYALGQGAPMIAAIWGVFVWKEFKGADKTVKALLAAMFVLFIGGLGCIVAAGNKPAEDTRVKVIMETDMGNDIDDALAMALMFHAADCGEVEVLAISNHKDCATATDFIGRLATFYGYENVPVGYCATPVTTSSTDYTALVNRWDSLGINPNRTAPAEESVTLYRKTLAAQPDHSVTVISLGFSTNLRALLESAPDQYSKLDGQALVAKKVKLLSIMAGSYRENPISEYNVYNDGPACQYLFEHWPSPIVQNPAELGSQALYPATAIEAMGATHPVAEAYAAYRPMPYDRPSWDILSVIYVLHPEMFTVGEKGKISVVEDPEIETKRRWFTLFEESPEGKDLVMQPMTPEQVEVVTDYFVRNTVLGE